ncbi:sensor histidine kinase [Flavisolibacter nicotianae]|uniref:sensor histidine kinase n=1 Tax=Flavisolibacter nicotianae TaxID=2364882 RepID=UPI0013C4771E|nr:ATP-binding protein [Flavisolibacter nicotianae]
MTKEYNQTGLSDGRNKIDEAPEDLSALLLEFKDYAIIRIDPAGYIRSWNLGAEDIYGYTHPEIIDQHISVFYGAKDSGKAANVNFSLQTALAAGRYEHEEWQYNKEEKPFFANIIITALYNADGTLKGFAKVTRDITREKTLEEENKILHEQLEEKVRQRTRELEIVNKELEAFSYSVSHDLRTPLRAISGYSMMLKEDYGSKLDGECNRIMDAILSNTKMMGQLIDDLLTFSKMARLETIYKSIEMNRLVQSCQEDLTNQPSRHVITIAALPACSGDASMLRQVWFNLLDNAIKYSSKNEKPQIEIGAKDDPGFHVYYVKDNGAGFDMKYASKLFGVFQRLHRQDEFEGTGLGLALVKRIISKHGGEIWADASPNKGATFYFSVPKNKQ